MDMLRLFLTISLRLEKLMTVTSVEALSNQEIDIVDSLANGRGNFANMTLASCVKKSGQCSPAEKAGYGASYGKT
jgi:hypothetical protein